MATQDRVVVIDYPPLRPYDTELAAVRYKSIPIEVVSYKELCQEESAATIVINAGDWPLGADVLKNLPACRAIVSYGVGVDWIDLKLAATRNLTVINSPRANTLDVAEHTLALILACAKHLFTFDREMRTGGFRPDPPLPLKRMHGGTVGFLAFGNIARAVSELLAPFRVKMCAYDPFVDASVMHAFNVEPVDWHTLASSVGILSVHLPATPETRGFLDARRLAALRRGCIVVVTSRGAIYDADAIADSLDSGHLAAVGLDVFPIEPLPAGHRLFRAPNVVMTPHVAGGTSEALQDARLAVASSLEALLDGRLPESVVTESSRHRSK